MGIFLLARVVVGKVVASSIDSIMQGEAVMHTRGIPKSTGQ
ncbi:hypothetical protein C404_17420 [Ralstonia sp. AU12-08]|nr:hypothetical protein C404_17420 [Ralstonia sp. AU12-08]